MLYPALIFAFNKRGNNLFNRGSVIDRLEGPIDINQFRDSIFKNIETKERIENSATTNMGNTPGNNTKEVSSNVSLIQQQKEEMEELERMDNEAKMKEKEEKLRIEREIKEKKEKEEMLEKIKQEKMKSLPPEPSADDVNSTHIIFRYPDGSRRQERRFMKTEKLRVI